MVAPFPCEEGMGGDALLPFARLMLQLCLSYQWDE